MIIYYLTLKILFHKLIQCVLQKEIGAMFFDLLLILSPITLQPKPFFKALYENISNQFYLTYFVNEIIITQRTKMFLYVCREVALHQQNFTVLRAVLYDAPFGRKLVTSMHTNFNFCTGSKYLSWNTNPLGKIMSRGCPLRRPQNTS